jgi:hypothetical protein
VTVRPVGMWALLPDAQTKMTRDGLRAPPTPLFDDSSTLICIKVIQTGHLLGSAQQFGLSHGVSVFGSLRNRL